MADNSPVNLSLNPETLKPLIRAVVHETLAEVEADRANVQDRLAYSEQEAAALLGLAPHQLRDERRRGRIAASQIVGRRVRYTRQDLLDYLRARRIEPSQN